MPLTESQISTLLERVASAKPDPLTCDDCHQQLAVFAEAQLASRPLSEAMSAVATHLSQCHCCCEEYELLLESLRALQA